MSVEVNQQPQPKEAVHSALGGARPKASLPLVVLVWLAAICALYVARDIAIPIVLAILLALLLRPLFRRLQRLHVPDVLASLLIVVFVAALFVLATVTFAQQGQGWLAKAPETIARVQAMFPQGGPLGNLAKATEAVKELAQPGAEPEDAPVPVVMQSSEATMMMLGTSGHFLASALIVFVLAFFILSFSDTLLKQAVESRSSFADKKAVVASLHNVENGISRYLATVTVINLGLGIVTAATMWLIGIPNPLLWGVLATVLNYVPHVGALVCEVVLFFVGAVAHESLWHGFGAAGAFFVITTVESYLITPLVLSKSLQLSPLAVIVSVLFWGWLWGIAGGLMAAPLLAVAKIVCDQFDALRPISVLLAGEVKASNGAVKSEAELHATTDQRGSRSLLPQATCARHAT